MKVLVTGGAGYIGSHMVLDLLLHDHQVVVFDNLSTGSAFNLDKVKQLSGKDFEFIQGDLLQDLDKLNIQVDAIIHFAAKKDVKESTQDPLLYYRNNISGTINLLKWAEQHDVNKFIFSSTSAVYGDTTNMPIVESEPAKPLSPYGFSKLFAERIISDAMLKSNGSAVLLRYFNVAGNVENGEIGDPNPNPAALIPVMIMAALGYQELDLVVNGDDYATKDGTTVRDFIHVLDLVEAHRLALDYASQNPGVKIFNLGNGKGFTILEVIKAFQEATGQELKYKVGPRRPGDIEISIADPTLVNQELNWHANRDLVEMIRSAWNWYKSAEFKSLRD